MSNHTCQLCVFGVTELLGKYRVLSGKNDATLSKAIAQKEMLTGLHMRTRSRVVQSIRHRQTRDTTLHLL